MRAVASESGGQSAVTTAIHREGAPLRISFHAAMADSLASSYAGGSFFLVSLLGRHGPGLRRALPERCCRSDGAWAMRPFATGSHPQRPCICRESWRGHGGAAHHLGLVRRNRPARQISPTCGLPREANFSGLPVLHCVAAPPLRFGMRRARTLTHRITPRPRWARPG